MSKTTTTRRARMLASAAKLPTVTDETPPAGIGDNQPPLPTLMQVDDSMRDMLQVIARSEAAIEHARQWLAYHIMRRDDVMRAADPNLAPLASYMDTGAKMEFDDIAGLSPRSGANARKTHRDAFKADLLTELCGPFVAHTDRKTNEDHDRAAHRGRVDQRLRRAVDLAIALAWRGYTSDDFDMERGKWPVRPADFCPPDYVPENALLMNAPDAKGVQTVRTSVWLENDPEDAGQRYAMSRAGSRPVRISVSLDQFMYATERHYVRSLEHAAKVEPTPVAPTAPAQAAADKAAAEAATPTPTPAPAPAGDTPAPHPVDAIPPVEVTKVAEAGRAPHHNDTSAADRDRGNAAAEEAEAALSTAPIPEADTKMGKLQRELNTASFCKMMMAVDGLLNHDSMAGLREDEVSKAVVNAVEAVHMLRMAWARTREDATAERMARAAAATGKAAPKRKSA